MSELDDRDLSAAFEELHAPASTASYATRSPGFEVPGATRSGSWPQALAAVVAVAVAVAGAGTFLALRSARQGGSPSSSGANPPARSGAAIAYDSSEGVTVMYGGTDGAGRQLSDTWTWNGSAWTTAAKGPGPLVDVRMVDDPAVSGVLLVGMPAPKLSGGSGGGVVGCISSGSGTGTASPGSVSNGGTPAGTNAGSALATPPVGGPIVTAAPTAIPAQPTCPPVAVAPAEQTWLFTSQGWSHAAAGSTTTPASGAQLTFDPTTRQVVAVSGSYFNCGPPLESASNGAARACPMLGASTKPGAAIVSPAPCDAIGGCFGNGSIATWTWAGGRWTKQTTATLPAGGITLLFNDPTTGHATLMTQSATGCPANALCPAPATQIPATVPLTSTWSWTGSGWRQVSQVHAVQQMPSVAGAVVAAVMGHIVVVTDTGQTWTFAAGQWTQDSSAGQPSTRSGAAMAEGPSGTVVLFGGTVPGGFGVPLPATSGTPSDSTGSDTWVWNGSVWKHVAGTTPSPPPAPSACPDVVSLQPRCVGPPTKVPPSTPAGVVPEAGGTPLP
ncbi:MAG TPA: hypothetical protein VIN65_06640 [Candidatus Dormibacteraeota bacterium]